MPSLVVNRVPSPEVVVPAAVVEITAAVVEMEVAVPSLRVILVPWSLPLVLTW